MICSPIEVHRFKCTSVKTILENFDLIANKFTDFDLTVGAAAIDAAGPISRLSDGTQQVVITNWSGDEERTLTTEKLPERLFPKKKTAMLNDLEAGCYGILALDAQGKLGKFFKPLYPVSAEMTKLQKKNCITTFSFKMLSTVLTSQIHIFTFLSYFLWHCVH